MYLQTTTRIAIFQSNLVLPRNFIIITYLNYHFDNKLFFPLG